MKSARVLIAASLFVIATSFAAAGPGPQYWAQRRAERANAAAATVKSTPPPAKTCCRVIKVSRPVASHKVSVAITRIECPGCAAMAAGEKCPSS